MSKSNMSFAVNENAVICNMLDGEIKGRMVSRNNPTKKKIFKDRRIIDSTNAITRFIVKYPNVFGNEKLVHRDGSNFFGGILPLSSLSRTDSYKDSLRSRMKYEYDLSDQEISEMDSFLDDFDKLKEAPEIQQIVSDTAIYKKSIEDAWKLNESKIMNYIISVLGYEPQNVGKVSTYVVYPTFNTHRCYQLTEGKSFLFFAKRDETDINKILAYLTHQAVHQPMLPYKSTMTKEDKEEFHAFIKFLTDKDVYNQLSGKSYLDIVTEHENPEVMGKVYPFWLGYRYRNVDKEGLNPVVEINKAIQRDKEYFDNLPQNSKKRKLYSTYEFEKLDAEKIAMLFREKRAITPYQFAKIDFDKKDQVYQDRYLKKSTTFSEGPSTGVR